MTNPKPCPHDDIIERLAAVEHERWSGWMKWEHRPEATDEDRARWKRQSDTPYEQLSEREREHDRIEVRKTLAEMRKTHIPVPRELLRWMCGMLLIMKSDGRWYPRGDDPPLKQAEKLLEEG